MNGQGDEECRTMRWDGTKATLYGKFSSKGHEIRVHYHLSGAVEEVPVIARDGSGHGGGDYGIVRSFLNTIKGAPDDSVTTARESLESHLAGVRGRRGAKEQNSDRHGRIPRTNACCLSRRS